MSRGSARTVHCSLFTGHSPILLAALALLLLAGRAWGAATDYYVATNGNDTASGLGWGANALLTISNGVAKATAAGAGSTVTVSNGTYNITTEIVVNSAITVRSFGNGVTGGLANAANTIIDGGAACRVFYLNNASAVVNGFTIRNGRGVGAVGNMYGGGVYMDNGLVRDCILHSNNIGGQHVDGIAIYMNGGTVTNSIIRNNNGGWNASQGVINANGGTIVDCQIVDNSVGNDGGGGVWAGGGVLIRNCLIARNTANGVGGGVQLENGTVESCTIVANHANSTSGGGGIYRGSGGAAGTVRNCIVYGNTSGHATYKNSNSGTAGWTDNCTTNPVVAGTGCISDDPLFGNLAEGNYQLSTGSPCIDTGDDSTVTWGADLAGKTRKQDIPGIGTASVDMGAYEYDGALSCSFVGSPRYLIASPITYQCFGTAPFTVQFTGSAGGTNLTGLVYRWDFDGDNIVDDDTSGATATYLYTVPGVYTPKLQVTNAVGEVADAFKTNYVSAGATHYVVTNNPSAESPYTNWAMAATSIQLAVDETINGALVIVSNGTYNISSAITFNNHIILRSFQRGLSGATNTVVRTGGAGCVLDARNAASDFVTVEGLTITGGSTGADNNSPVGLNMAGGLVRDCIVTGNNNGNRGDGGIHMTGGTVSNCVISANTGGRYGGNAGGIAALGACNILACNIYGNNANGTYAGGVYLNDASAVARNCRIALGGGTKSAGGISPSRGVYLANGLVENCTIVTNRADANGGGVYRAGGTVRNCIIYYNWVTTGGNVYSNYYGDAAGLEYSCTTNPVVAGTGCISDDPLFVNPAAGDYSLQVKPVLSPCIDLGDNQSWMTGAKDLAGNDRIQKGKTGLTVDMGAYETFVPPAGTIFIFR